MNLLNWSTDLHLEIASFLDDNGKAAFGSCCARFYNELLLNYLRRVKIPSISNFLNDFESNEDTRERFAKYIHSPELQAHVHVPMYHSATTFPLPRVHDLAIMMDQTHLLRQIEKIHTLYLGIDFSQEYSKLFLPESLGIKTLCLSNHGDTVPSSLPVIAPRSLDIMILRGPFSAFPTNFSDIIPHLHELYLHNIECVSDVSMFVTIKKISFFCCHNLIDITPLQTTSNISIDSCRGIVDYRNALTYSQCITIRYPNADAIIDVSCFKVVRSLELAHSYKSIFLNVLVRTCSINLKRLTIQGDLHHVFNDFSHLQELSVSSSSILTKVDIFGCIPVLQLFSLENVESLDGLGYDEDKSKRLRNRSVTISQLRKVEDFTPLNTVPIVDIGNCERFHDLSQVKDVKNLTIGYCFNLLEPSVPMNSEKIKLGAVIPTNLFLFLPNVKELDLCFVYKDDLKGLENLKKLERIMVPNDWKEEEMLKQDYLKFEYDGNNVIYVKKKNSF